jgi:DNA-binding transcriptional LysR family regulator
MEIDPRRLRFLLAVARTGGVLAAADELRVTPSAVSQQIARLEKETGRTLLQRTPSGSLLTPVGLALAEAAEDVERALTLARTRLEHDESEVSGTVRLGGFQSFLATIVAPALPDWRSRYPALSIDTVEAEEADMMRWLRTGSLEGVIVELDAEGSYAPPRGTHDVPLLDEPWKLVVPTGALLATDVVDLGRITLPWLGVDPSAASSHAISRVRRALGAETTSRHVTYSTQTALALVAAGEGVALVPSLALVGYASEGVDALDVPGLGMRRVVLRLLTRARASATLETATMLLREAAAAFSFADAVS